MKEDPQDTAGVAQLETQGNNWAQAIIRPGEVFLTEVTGPQIPVIPQGWDELLHLVTEESGRRHLQK